MPEPEPKENKLSGEKKAKKSDASKTKQNKSTKNLTRPKIKPNIEDGIAKSKQLVLKLQARKSNSSGKSKSRSSKSTEVKFCGNGKPMPSLAELERMFEDSDDEEGTPSTNQNNPGTSTPVPKPQTSENSINLTSPKTIEKIASRMLDLVTNLTDPPVILEDDEPPPPVIKPKKRKKSGIPYIVGCKDRPYVPSKPNNSVFKGEEEYGVDKDGCDDEADDIPTKRAKRGKKINLSKSIFNAASDEIAARLKEQDEGNSDASSDSNKTIAYEYYTPNPNNRSRSFSPLPSTSRDNNTFEKNDQLFNESLISENASTTCNDNDIEIIETPCETIVINDSITNTKSRIIEDSSVIELIDESSGETAVVNTNTNIVNDSNNDSVQIVDFKPPSPIPVDEYYSSCCTVSPPDYDVCEVIDIDNIIAETSAIIKKYSRKNDLDTVTSVDMSSSVFDGGTSVHMVNETIPIDNVNTPLANSTIATIGNNENILQNSEQNVQLSVPINNQKNRNAEVNNHQSHDIYPRVCEIDNNSSISTNQAAEQDAYHRSSQVARAETSMNSQKKGNRKRIGDCPICMDSLSNKTLASTLCGHVFCMNCIKQSIKSIGKKCPTCRKTLRGAGFHQIFL